MTEYEHQARVCKLATSIDPQRRRTPAFKAAGGDHRWLPGEALVAVFARLRGAAA